MAMIRVCDRCESDERINMLSLSIGIPEKGEPTRLKGPMSNYFREVDLCAECVIQLNGFLDGSLLLDTEEETDSEESKKEQDAEYQSRIAGTTYDPTT